MQILRDEKGQPQFVVMPYAAYIAHFGAKPDAVPHAVIERMVTHQISLSRAWREHLGLTQAEVAKRMGVSAPAVVQYEASANLRKATLVRLAQALGIYAEQLQA